MARRTKINLLSQDQFERTKIGRLVTWALTVGRYIVIGTELIVILAFLSRFKLDRDLTDLGEEIKQKQVIIESFEGLEKEVRFVQDRLKLVKNLIGGQLGVSRYLSVLGKLTPAEVAFSEVSFDKEVIRLKGRALSNEGLAVFLEAVKKSPYFSRVNLNSLSSQAPAKPGVEFEMEVKVSGL